MSIPYFATMASWETSTFFQAVGHFFTRRTRYLPFLVLVCVAFCFIGNNPFFWDSTQFGSAHAQWYYSTRFAHFFLPTDLDSGHPPMFGMYIAVWWFLFGKSLVVSHLAVLPFALGSVYLLFKVGDYFLGRRKSYLFVLLAFADPTFTAQHVLVSPDALVVFCLLLALYGIVVQARFWLLLGVLGMCAISMRGMVLVFALYVFELLQLLMIQKEKKRFFVKGFYFLLAYLPAIVLGLGFLLVHYGHTGWNGYHPDSPWAACFQRVNAMEVARNVLVAGFRFLEFGRIGIVVALLVLGIGIKSPDTKLKQLLLMLFIFICCLIPPQLPYKVLLSPRYLLPISLLLSLLLCYFLSFLPRFSPSQKAAVWVACLVCLASGNFWVYPPTISMAWDATLQHLCYFKPRAEMLRFINEQAIPIDQIQSMFPENRPFGQVELTADPRQFAPFDFGTSSYIYYSNVMNGFSTEELNALKHSWIVVKRFQKGGVEVILYKRP